MNLHSLKNRKLSNPSLHQWCLQSSQTGGLMRSSAQDTQARDLDIGYLQSHYLYWAVFLGSIYRATHIHTKQVVALKVQDVNHECPSNRYERRLYPLLQGGVGMPRLYAAGVAGMWDYLAIELLGASLDNIYRRSGKDVMDIRSVLSITIQVVSESHKV